MLSGRQVIPLVKTRVYPVSDRLISMTPALSFPNGQAPLDQLSTVRKDQVPAISGGSPAQARPQIINPITQAAMEDRTAIRVGT